MGAALAALVLPPPAAAQTADEEARIRRLEQQVTELRQELAALGAARPAEEGDRLAELARRIDVVAGELETMRLGEAAAVADRSEKGLGAAASKVYREKQGLSIGGYGEMLFQGFAGRRDDGVRAERRDQLDFLRGIIYVGYKLDDHWLFNSELEVEHAVTGEDAEGEVALEFAYLDRQWRRQLNFRAGLLLVPMGFLNELHEPPLFLGARRPDVERAIIPTTWRENGIGIYGDLGPFTYRSYLLNGLDATGFEAEGIREGRQEGSETVAEDLGWVARLDYTARPGLLAGVSAYVGDSGQGLSDRAGRIGARTTLYEAHLEWKWRGFQLRALGVRGAVDDAARLNGALALAGEESIGAETEGYYLELGYDVLARLAERRRSLIPYLRWESFDTQRRVPAGFRRNPANDVEVLTWGLAFRPLDQLVVKADYQDFDNGAGTALDQLNVAIGYLF